LGALRSFGEIVEVITHFYPGGYSPKRLYSLTLRKVKKGGRKPPPKISPGEGRV